MEPVLRKGRPLTIEQRLDKEVRVYDLLDSLHIEYDRNVVDDPGWGGVVQSAPSPLF